MTTKAFTMAFITVVIWGSTFAGIRASLHGGYTAGHLVLVRYLIASTLFALYALWPGTKFRLPRKGDLVRIFILSFIGISIYHIGVSFGEETVSAGTAGMIVGSSPIYTTIIAMIFLKERLRPLSWLGLAIGFLGIVFIAIGSEDSSVTLSKGTLLVLMSAVATSIFFVFQKQLLHRYRPIELTAYFTWVGTLPFFIFAPGVVATVQNATLEANLSALYTGIFPAAVAYVTWATALSLGNASTVSSVLYLEPAIAVIIAWLWLNEWPSTLSIIGGIIALVGVVITNVLGKQQRKIPTKHAT